MNHLLYPIRAVSMLTGTSVDALRAWERRYQAVTPQRIGRQRMYTEANLERLRLLRAALDRGHAIGRLAGLSDEELRELTEDGEPFAVEQQKPAVNGAKLMHQNVLEAVIGLDYAAAERELGLLAALLPPRELVSKVVLPLMKDVGEGWHQGGISIAQEHMTSSLLRNLMGGLIPLHRRSSVACKLLFATPSGEHHEFGILVSAMLAVAGGLGIVYLGPNLPGSEILMAAQKTVPQAVIVGFVGANGAASGLNDLRHIAEHLPSQTELWVGGTRDSFLADEIRKTRALLIEDFDMLAQHLRRLGARF